MPRRPAQIALGAAFGLLLALPAAAATLRWANDGDATAMDPYTRNETFQGSLLSNIYEPLIRRNRELKLEPALALRWEQPGPTTWRFHLRPGVKWQDGSAFTADDVVFSVGRARSEPSLQKTIFLPAAGQGGEARRRADGRVRDDAARPDPGPGTQQFPHHVQGLERGA